MLHKLSAVLGVQLLELMVACGVDPEAMKQKELEDNADADKQATDTNLAPEHSIKAILKAEDGLSGLSGTYELVNCTGHVDAAFQSNKISLPDEAIGCRIAISSIQLGDRVFHMTDKNAEWKTGDVLHFRADDSLESLDVKVDHQLSATPGLSEDVSFTVSRSDAAADAGSKTLLAAGMEGQMAPNFRIRKTEFTGMTDGGAGQFVFHLDCLKAITVVTGETPSCNGISISDIHYRLVKDEYNSILTFDQADALFASDAGLAVDASADFEPFKAERKQYGGFVTKSGVDVLEGPGRIHDNPNMLLILQGPGPSYQYFNVDVVFTSN